jgi:hypothetical protein
MPRSQQLSIHTNQKLVVVFGVLHVFQEGIHGLFRVHVRQMIPQYPHSLVGDFVDQQIIPTRA